MSSRESSEAEIASPPIEYTSDLMQKLKRTRAGCNLLTRLGCDKALVGHLKEPMYTMNFEVPEKMEKAGTIERRSKIEKRPPSALTVGIQGL